MKWLSFKQKVAKDFNLRDVFKHSLALQTTPVTDVLQKAKSSWENTTFLASTWRSKTETQSCLNCSLSALYQVFISICGFDWKRATSPLREESLGLLDPSPSRKTKTKSQQHANVSIFSPHSLLQRKNWAHLLLLSNSFFFQTCLLLLNIKDTRWW